MKAKGRGRILGGNVPAHSSVIPASRVGVMGSPAVDIISPSRDYICMFMSTVEAAAELGISDRQVRRAVEGGHIQAEHVAGRLALYEKQVYAYKRARRRGRNWSGETRLAALDMLNGIKTEHIAGSQKSRLKARLRGMDAAALASHILADVAVTYDSGGREVVGDSALHSELGLVGAFTQVLVAHGSKREAAKRRLARNHNGNVIVIEGDAKHQCALEAAALYTHGDTRERAAAERWIEQRKAAIR